MSTQLLLLFLAYGSMVVSLFIVSLHYFRWRRRALQLEELLVDISKCSWKPKDTTLAEALYDLAKTAEKDQSKDQKT